VRTDCIWTTKEFAVIRTSSLLFIDDW